MGGKKGGGSRTPHIAPNTLESKQKIKLIHLLCSGIINGWQRDSLLKSIRFNDTYVQNSDGTFNFNNVRVNYLSGDLDQDYLVGFDGIERTTSVGAQVTKRTPITRTITDPLVGSLRVTLGVNALFRQTDQGDMYGTHVDLSIQTIKNNKIHSSVIWSLNEKGNTPFKQDATISDLPEAPFDLKIVRLTDDSMSDKLKNDTMFHSFVEVIPQKFSYPTCAVVGVELDAEQLGGQVPTINYEVLGREVQVPTNYDPVTRKYSGLWDGSFKSAYTNNIAWIVYDLMTDKIHGLGSYFKETIIDKMKLYEISQYSDVMVDDGNGGKEPRYVFNGLIQGNDATTILHNLCSVFRGRPVEKNGFISFIYDKGNENPVFTYTNANVIDGVFNYTHAPLDTRINSVQYEYADERDGCKIKVEEISNHKSIAKYNRINTEKITCYGQTRRSAALRHAKWFLETAETETESVDFIVGFQGVMHGAFDVVAIADNNKAGIPIGGRILSIDGNIVTLDREVVGAKEIRIRKDLYTVKDQIGGDKYRLDRAIEAKPYDVFSANTDRATERLFKVISTEENEDGSYTISAVKYNAQKQSVVDSSVSQYPEIETSLNPAPVLTDGNIANQGDYLLLTWDSLASVGTEVTYNVQIFKDNKHYQTHTTKEPMLKLYNLPMGEYYAKIKGRTSTGIYSTELLIPFSTTYIIHNLATKPAVFGFDIFWDNPPLITTNSKVEVWISDDNETFSKTATLAYPQDTHTIRNLSIGDELYVKVRIVDDRLNYGEFTDSVLGKPSQNSDEILSYLEGQITTKELNPEVIGEIADKALDEIKDDIDGIIEESEIIKEVKDKTDMNETDLRILTLSKTTSDDSITHMGVLLSAKTDINSADIKIGALAEATADRSRSAQYLMLHAETENTSAQFDELKETVATENEAMAQEITKLTATVGENEAGLTTLAQTVASVDGTVKSQYTLVTETTVDGERYASGFTSIQDGKTSEFVIQADKFAIINKQNGQMKTPFIIAQNKMVMDGDMIATGSISGDKIVANASIQAPIIKGGRVESGHFAGGSINIGNGNFSVDSNGNLLAKSGRFEGTVYAQKIEGDVVRVMAMRSNPLVISPVSYNREIIVMPFSFYYRTDVSSGAWFTISAHIKGNGVEIFKKTARSGQGSGAVGSYVQAESTTSTATFTLMAGVTGRVEVEGYRPGRREQERDDSIIWSQSPSIIVLSTIKN